MNTKSKIIAICNQKGGVGKTVTTVNLGIGLARQGKRVLLVDVDAQGSLTASLGYQNPDQIEVTLSTVLGKVIEDKPLLPGEGIIITRKVWTFSQPTSTLPLWRSRW